MAANNFFDESDEDEDIVDTHNLQPYRFEPLRAENMRVENIIAMEEAPLEDEVDGDRQWRLERTDWCQCGCCGIMPFVAECVCCREVNVITTKRGGKSQ